MLQINDFVEVKNNDKYTKDILGQQGKIVSMHDSPSAPYRTYAVVFMHIQNPNSSYGAFWLPAECLIKIITKENDNMAVPLNDNYSGAKDILRLWVTRKKELNNTMCKEKTDTYVSEDALHKEYIKTISYLSDIFFEYYDPNACFDPTEDLSLGERFITPETHEAIKAAQVMLRATQEHVDTFYIEVKVMLDACPDYDAAMQVLKSYGIIDSTGKMSDVSTVSI